MLISVICLIASLLSFMVVMRLLRMKKHDTVLYRFCQTRRGIMKILRERGFELKKEEYLVLRELLGAVSTTIHHYDHCKTTIFNLRKLQAFARQLKHDNEEMEKFNNVKDKDIRKIISMLRVAMFAAFFAYTPLVRSSFTLFLLGKMVRGLSSIGLRGLNGTASFLFWLDEQVTTLPARAIKV